MIPWPVFGWMTSRGFLFADMHPPLTERRAMLCYKIEDNKRECVRLRITKENVLDITIILCVFIPFMFCGFTPHRYVF